MVIPTRFIVKNEDGSLAISGHPGVALCNFGITDSEGFEKALDWYLSVVNTNTFVIASSPERIRALREKVVKSLEIDSNIDSPKVTGHLYLGTAYELAWIENEDLSVGEVLDHFSSKSEVTAFLMLNNSAGEFFRNEDDGIRYFIRSNESGHGPHVHVSYKNEAWASIYIDTGKIRDGSLPAKVYKTAKKRILANKEKLLDYWNNNTNGIHFDINYLFANQDCKK